MATLKTYPKPLPVLKKMQGLSRVASLNQANTQTALNTVAQSVQQTQAMIGAIANGVMDVYGSGTVNGSQATFPAIPSGGGTINHSLGRVPVGLILVSAGGTGLTISFNGNANSAANTTQQVSVLTSFASPVQCGIWWF